jgi:dynein heavy chain
MPTFGQTSFSSPRFREQLEYCMAEGKTLVVIGVENELDPMMTPILEKQIITKAKSKYITVSGKACDYNDEFMLYLVTRYTPSSFSFLSFLFVSLLAQIFVLSLLSVHSFSISFSSSTPSTHSLTLSLSIDRLPNPTFTPEDQSKCTIVDFTVTQKGLEEQLLGRVIQKEQR